MEIDIENLSNKLVDKAVKEGYDEVVAMVLERNSVMTKIVNSEISVAQKWNVFSIALYLVKNRRIFVVFLEPSRIEDVDKSMKELLSIASSVSESQLYAPLPEPESVESLNMVDSSVVEAMNRIDVIAERIIEVSHREKIDSVAGMIQLGYVNKSITSSKGVSAKEFKTYVNTYLRAFAEQGSGQWCYTSTKLDVNNIEKTALITSRLAVDSRTRVDVEPGVYDVILSPMVFGNLLNYIIDMTSAFSVMVGTSMFMNKKISDKIASEKLTIYDSPRDIELPGATGFDDEIVKTFNKPVIEKGVLKTFLHNTKTALAMSTKTTANAGWISPKPWNIVVDRGDASLDEMIAEVRRGLIITNNWYTRLQNYVEGIFSTVTRDAMFLIENGKIVSAVNKIRIADTFNNILNNIEMIGKELYNVQWWEVEIPSKVPYVLIKNIKTSKHFA